MQVETLKEPILLPTFNVLYSNMYWFATWPVVLWKEWKRDYAYKVGYCILCEIKQVESREIRVLINFVRYHL